MKSNEIIQQIIEVFRAKKQRYSIGSFATYAANLSSYSPASEGMFVCKSITARLLCFFRYFCPVKESIERSLEKVMNNKGSYIEVD